MLAFLIRRSIQAVIVMFVISLIGFSIQGHLGDPLRELVGQSVSEAERQALREQLGLNDPFFVQYFRFLGNAVQGDLGTSYFFKRPALDVILSKFPATFELVLGSVFIFLSLSIPAGIYCAIHRNSWLTQTIMSVSILGISVPVFLTAILLVWLFGVELRWMPAFGRGEVYVTPWGWDTGFLTWDGLLHLVLPCISLSSIMLPLFIRLIRAEMMEAMGTDYVRFAKAKGLRTPRIRYVHAFRNTLLPVVTVGGLMIGTLIAYTILTETVFQWPGMGFLFLEAVNRVDTPLIIAYIIFVGFIFVVVNTIVDFIYTLINPMVKLPGAKS
ncbi:ABC transporter permease [Roseovarius spongiae]|uniref:ABC transporter permease n=1 Tax=Roseovarius spongiae TaxID=2320272 RepID=A0A3A8B749_9RHOB|nr:ABC transporter permease [Roseovarius spongiae]